MMDDLPDPELDAVSDVPTGDVLRDGGLTLRQATYLRMLYTPSAERVTHLSMIQKRKLAQWDYLLEEG